MNAKKQSGGLFLLVDLAEFELLYKEGHDNEAKGHQRQEEERHIGTVTQEETDEQDGNGDREAGLVGWIGFNQHLVSILHLDRAGTDGLDGQDGRIACWKWNVHGLGLSIGHFCHFNSVDKDFQAD